MKDIRVDNIVMNNIQKNGISEMPISAISFSNVIMSAQEVFSAKTGKGIAFRNADLSVSRGTAFSFEEYSDLILSDVRSKVPLANQPIEVLKNVQSLSSTTVSKQHLPTFFARVSAVRWCGETIF